jgi:hypothetical protein
VPVTEADIRLVVAMFSGADGVRCKLAELAINRADDDAAAAVASTRHGRKRQTQQS